MAGPVHVSAVSQDVGWSSVCRPRCFGFNLRSAAVRRQTVPRVTPSFLFPAPDCFPEYQQQVSKPPLVSLCSMQPNPPPPPPFSLQLQPAVLCWYRPHTHTHTAFCGCVYAQDISVFLKLLLCYDNPATIISRRRRHAPLSALEILLSPFPRRQEHAPPHEKGETKGARVRASREGGAAGGGRG